MWCAGSRAWAGLTHEAILEAVKGPWQLAVPSGLPAVLQQLMLAAMAKEPTDRWGGGVLVCVCWGGGFWGGILHGFAGQLRLSVL